MKGHPALQFSIKDIAPVHAFVLSRRRLNRVIRCGDSRVYERAARLVPLGEFDVGRMQGEFDVGRMQAQNSDVQ